MVVPIRELVNIQLSNSAFSSKPFQMTNLPFYMDMDVDSNIIRGILQTQDLRVGQKKEPCIGFTQENSIENSVQDCLPYILISNGLCKLLLAYPK